MQLLYGFGTSKTSSVSSNNTKNYDYYLTEENYAASLKTIHENIEANIGKSICLSGFVFRMPDFKENFFVCGRNVIFNKEDKIAGFLCQSDNSSKLLDSEWIEVSGIIIKGEYNGDMPVIKIGSIKKIDAPANTFIKNVEPTI